MEFLERKLKRTSTIKKGEPFLYAIKRAQEEHKVPNLHINLNEIEKPRLSLKIEKKTSGLILENHSVPISATGQISSRRSNRFNTLDISIKQITPPKLGPFNDLTSPRSSKNRVEIPLDFTSSLSSTSKRGKEETFSSMVAKHEAETPKFDACIGFPEEYKEISEMSSSKEISFPEPTEKKYYHEKKTSYNEKPKRDVKTHSISCDLDKSEGSIIYNSPDRFSIQPKCSPLRSPKSIQLNAVDFTLETEKIEAPIGVLNPLSSIQSIPDIEADEENSKNIRDGVSSKTEIYYMTFDEALSKFYSLPVVYIEANLWYKDCYYYLTCGLSHKTDLSVESQELCEKIIIFAYSGFVSSNIFHISLLTSVYNALQILKGYKGEWIDVGFSSNNPYDNDLTHDMAVFGLLLIMFLDKYIPVSLGEMISYCLSKDIAFIPLAFDVAEICIIALRKRKLNALINSSQKCLEVLFFFYAGCLAYWFNNHKTNSIKHGEINGIVEKLAFSDPKSLINLAAQHLQNQM
ncbi:hypothetical protein SteCoe_27106 [Stentor coeruleus]|uniref:ELMO domain-containing protein n=1 Tax=Stentor coeruleus TaxID=5963 RepID=A0A1R2BB73_9CILI|nr:hypothetical protein SteCoe_27106 [Stentor coeruleus]